MNYSVAVDSAAFTATGSGTSLLRGLRLSVPISYRTTLNGYLRGLLDPVTFVGANTASASTVAMPSHQVGDLIIVCAANFASALTSQRPITPNSPTGQPQWTEVRNSGLAGTGVKIAYIVATQNTSVVGSWTRANRVTVAIYRNAKGIKGRGVDGGAFDNNFVRYSAVTGLLSAQQPTLVAFSGTEANLDAALTPPGFTTRTSTDAVGGAAPGIGLHDKTVAIGDDTQPLADVATSSATDTFSVTLIVEAGTPGISAETSSFQTTLSGDIHVRTFIPRRATFRAELANVLTLYSSFYDAGSASFAASVPAVDTHFGFYLAADSASYASTNLDANLARALRYLPQSGAFTGTEGSAVFARGYFREPGAGSFTTTFGSIGLTHSALISARFAEFDASVAFELKRSLITPFTGNSFSAALSEVGIRNESQSSPTGGPVRKSTSDYGGSNSSRPSFLRPENVKYNSVSKSRDIGLVNNFLGQFSGDIGSEVGSPTLFFKVDLIGDASLQIKKNKVNRFTDNHISVGILDADRKPVLVNDSGFAYKNEITSTPDSEFLAPMPKGTYYFTISSTQWQKIPYSVDVQAIRFVGLKGVVTLTSTSTARFAIAKFVGPALLTGPFAATVPSSAQLKQPTGPATMSAALTATAIIPSGVAIGRISPYGRLKMTHKISGHAGGQGANVATLSAAPPSYGGYGP